MSDTGKCEVHWIIKVERQMQSIIIGSIKLMESLGLPTLSSDAVPHSMVLIGLVAIQNEENKKWCATHETRGWYMPAGRIDLGEGIETGAKREALEEAGVHVDLLHVVRLDFSPSQHCCRFRAIFQAKLSDPQAKLRDPSTADDEIIEAAWVEPHELNDGRKVRSLEMVTLFRFLNETEGSLRVPASFVRSIDGSPISHDKVKTETILSVTIIAFSSDYNKLLISSENTLISSFMGDKPFMFSVFASNHPMMEEAQLLGYSCLRYAPPHDGDPLRVNGHMNAVIVFQLNQIPKDKDVKCVKVADVLSIETPILPPVETTIVRDIIEKKHLFPEAIIDLEGSRLQAFKEPETKSKGNCLLS